MPDFKVKLTSPAPVDELDGVVDAVLPTDDAVPPDDAFAMDALAVEDDGASDEEAAFPPDTCVDDCCEEPAVTAPEELFAVAS